MNKLITLVMILIVASSISLAQGKGNRNEIRELRKEAQQELREMKQQTAAGTNLVPSDFNDTDSFNQNVRFLGSLYAGTLYVYKSCDPAVLLADLDLTLAADDHCAAHNFPSAQMPTTDAFDNVWQITIPKDTIENVIYPLLNFNVEYDSTSGIGGLVSIRYTPRVTIESDALNDPAALDPVTGTPLNGSLTVSLPGTRVRSFMVPVNDFVSDLDSYAAVSGRGLSRAYFRSLGLPNNVINKLYKKKMVLKFGIRARVIGPIDYAHFSYTFRLMGQ